jgi:hypothetical protein
MPRSPKALGLAISWSVMPHPLSLTSSRERAELFRGLLETFFGQLAFGNVAFQGLVDLLKFLFALTAKGKAVHQRHHDIVYD